MELDWFRSLSTAIGPVAALEAVVIYILFKRKEELTDMIISMSKDNAALMESFKNAITNLTERLK